MDPFLGEIRTFSWNFPPRGWALCNGALMAISQNQALFSLLGVMYGGNGQTTFGLPDLQGRSPIHVGTIGGQPYQQGQRAGTETVQLTTGTLPSHGHAMTALGGTAGNAVGPSGNLPAKVGAQLANGATVPIYTTSIGATVPLATDSVGNSGGTAAHNNMQPYLVLNFCIATQGIYPTRS